jgi:tetratricopeptide (TPR) repeat protein
VTVHGLKQSIAEALRRGDFAAAELGCESMVRDGSLAEGMHLQGILRLAQGDQEKAVALLQRARALSPERGDVAYDHGVALLAAGRLADAADAWLQAVTLSPDRVDAWRNLALAVSQTDNGIASKVYRQALIHHPQDRELLYNYGNLCFRRGDLSNAAQAQAALLTAHPQFAAGWINAGMTHKAARRFDEAEACYRRAIGLNDPASLALAHFNLANGLLQQGRWAEGFAEYEWRLRLPNSLAQPWPAPPWTGGHPAGSRVLVWNDQGMGDAIQFLRLTARLADKGYRVLALVQDQLKTLAASAPGVEAAFGPEDLPQAVDAHVPLCSLPHVLGWSPDDAWNGPYLRTSRKISLPVDADGRSKRVGLVWAGNPTHANDANRSMRLADLQPLLDRSGVTWFSLQLGKGPSELSASRFAGRMHDLSPMLEDFSATAAVLMELDLLISVDTAAAHLAGALGRPVWMLLPAIGGDWRWGITGETTAWYPSARLFRQQRAGDWAPTMHDVAAALAATSF